jgi:prepilin-type N-terminal cleavage/methylation domain-containing protein
MTSRPASRAGFTLLEVMAAIALLAIIFATVMQVRQGAVAKATDAYAKSVASRLGLGLMRRIECGLVPDLYDGFQGDFSEEGYGDFTYLIGLGDGSQYAGGDTGSSAEDLWREQRRDDEEDREEDALQPEFTRVFITVTYPNPRIGEEESATFVLETLIDTWAVYQDFALYEVLWPDLTAEAIE